MILESHGLTKITFTPTTRGIRNTCFYMINIPNFPFTISDKNCNVSNGYIQNILKSNK